MGKLTAQQAIDTSIQENHIVTLEHPNGGDDLADTLDTLSVECDDNTSYPGPEEDGTYIYEYWGEQDDKSWRVHVVGPKRN